jgi:hypothetical protein
MKRIPVLSALYPALIAGAVLALAGPAMVHAKGGHGGHGGGGNGGSAVSFAPRHQGSGGASGAVRPASGSGRPAAASSYTSGSGCSGRDERGNCLTPRVRDPDYSGP